MKTRIILPLDEGLTEQEKHTVKQLLVDALAEFVKTRSPAESYVTERYTDRYFGFVGSDKVKEVEYRIALASKLKHAAYDVLIAEAEDKP